MCVNRNINLSDKKKLDASGVVAIDKSIDSLVNFLDKLLKCIHDTLDKLENYYQTYRSAVQTGMEWNIHEKSSEQKKIDSKYNYIKNQLEEFLTCIVKDYAEFMQDAYEIRTLHEKYDSHINYLQQLSLNNKRYNELDALISKVEKMKKQIDKIVLRYNADITKLSYLKLNLRYRVIVYRSSFTGQSFSIPINVLIRNFKNLIQSNKLVVIANQVHASLLEQPLSNMKNLSEEPDLIYARSVNLDPLLINTTGKEIRQSSSAEPPKPEFPPKGPLPPNFPRKESPIQVSTQQERQKIPNQDPNLIYVRSINMDPLLNNTTEKERRQPLNIESSKPASLPEGPLPPKLPRKDLLTQKSTQQEPLRRKPRRQEPSQVETPVGGTTTPITETKSLETFQPRAKSGLYQTTPEGAESQSLEVDKSNENKIKQKRKDPNDEIRFTAESEMDVTDTEYPQEDTSSMPSLRDELLEAERLSAPSSSSSSIQPQPRKSVLQQKFKQRLEQRRKQFSGKIPIKAKKVVSKKYVPAKPIPELIAIDKQKIITQEFYEETYKQLGKKISKIEKNENKEIVYKNEELCRHYHVVQTILNEREKKLTDTEREIEEIYQSGIKPEELQENLKEKQQMMNQLQTLIVDDKLAIRKIQYQVQRLDKRDHDLQIYKNFLYDVQRHLCQRWLEQLNKSLALETDTQILQQLRADIRIVKSRIENLFSEIKDLHSGYQLRKKRRMIAGPYKANFCMKQFFDLDELGRKYGEKAYKPDLVNDPFSQEEDEPEQKIIPPSAPINVLIPKRKPQ